MILYSLFFTGASITGVIVDSIDELDSEYGAYQVFLKKKIRERETFAFSKRKKKQRGAFWGCGGRELELFFF